MKKWLFIVSTILLYSCKPSYCGGRSGMSKSLEDSKENGVFINSYDLEGDSILNIFDSTYLQVLAIYRERQFEYDDNFNIIVDNHKSQLIVWLTNSVPESYDIKWRIGKYEENYFTKGYNYLKSDIESDFMADTLKFEVYFDKNHQKDSKEVIPELVFIQN
jgi:hypothetical protein